jgi:RHS repeat-associated protein
MSRTYFFWDPLSDNILQERDESGTVTAEYTTEPGLYGNLISQNRGGVESQYHFDPQGSTLALTDDNQQITDNYAYTAFGEVTEHTGSTVNVFRFSGKQGYYTDQTTEELIVRQRLLETSRGCWLSPDPIGSGIGMYIYSENTPPNRTDPSGLISQNLRSQLESIGFNRILCDASSRRDWFDRMEVNDPKATPIKSRHIMGPAKGGLESVAGLVALRRPYSCKHQNLLFVAAFEATNVNLMTTIFSSTGSQINSVQLFVRTSFRNRSTCSFAINKAYAIKEQSKGGNKVFGLSVIAICPVKCENNRCQPIGFDSVVYAKFLGSYQTRPGQMLLWQARFCPRNVESPSCCISSCEAATQIAQLESGWNYNSLGPDGSVFGEYTGPKWGRPYKDVKIGEEPVPKPEGIDAYIKDHIKKGNVVEEPCEM